MGNVGPSGQARRGRGTLEMLARGRGSFSCLGDALGCKLQLQGLLAERLRLEAARFCTVGDRPGLKQDKGRNLQAEQSIIQGWEGSSGGGQGGRGDPADKQQLSSASDAIRRREKADLCERRCHSSRGLVCCNSKCPLDAKARRLLIKINWHSIV